MTEEAWIKGGMTVWLGLSGLTLLFMIASGGASLALPALAFAGLAAAWWVASDVQDLGRRLSEHGGPGGVRAIGAFAVLGPAALISGNQWLWMFAGAALLDVLRRYGEGPVEEPA